MTSASKDAAFWTKIARKYADSPIRDMEGYQDTLDRTKSYLTPTDRALEIGCGTGSTALLLAPHVAHITATDIAPGMIDIAHERLAQSSETNVTFKVSEVLEHEAEGTSFDAVMAHNLLHLLPDLDAALLHVRSLLKPGGVFISKTVVAPSKAGLKYGLLRHIALPVMQALGKAPFVQFPTTEDLDARIEQAGFTIVETVTQSGLLPSRYIVAKAV